MISDLMSFLRIIDVFYMPRAEVCVIKSWLLIILTHQDYYWVSNALSSKILYAAKGFQCRSCCGRFQQQDTNRPQISWS